ncbi:MAG: DUF177 domain-containing protein [Caldilineales bacterium]
MKTSYGTEFNVAQLLKEPIGGRRSYLVEIPPDFQEQELRQSDPLTGTVEMLRTNSGVLLEAVLEGSVTVECSRCLRDVRCPVTVEIVEEFQPTVDVVRGTFVAVEEEDAALLINEHHVLDIGEVVRQALLLEVPLQALCREDCAGLCPTCGEDLNLGPCGCPQETIDPRWEALAALRLDEE